MPPRAGGAITTAILLLGILALAIGGWRTSQDVKRDAVREVAVSASGSRAMTTSPSDAPTAIAPPVSASTPKYRTRPIGEMRTGQRVLARNPQLDPAEVVSSDINPATWRNVRLRMQKSTGGQLDIVLLRPVEWLEESGIDERDFARECREPDQPLQAVATLSSVGELPAANLWPWHSVTRATSQRSNAVVSLFATSNPEPTGKFASLGIEGSHHREPAKQIVPERAAPTHSEPAPLLTTVPESSTPTEPPSQPWIFLDLPEIGANGPAEVLAIEPCPEIEAGLGQIVTGTFAHSAANVIDVVVEGLDEPIGCTANHPFWSEDRQDFFPAGTLQPGETLRTESGTMPQIIRITPRRGPPVTVCSLEADSAHVYYVSAAGMLVHKSCLNRGGSYDDLNEMKEAGEVPHQMP